MQQQIQILSIYPVKKEKKVVRFWTVENFRCTLGKTFASLTPLVRSLYASVWRPAFGLSRTRYRVP